LGKREEASGEDGGEVMSINRREFLRLAGLSTLFGMGGQAAFELIAPGQLEAQTYTSAPNALKAKRWAMVVDMRKLDEKTAEKCVQACHFTHNVPDVATPKEGAVVFSPEDQNRFRIKWIWKEDYHNAFPGDEHANLQEKLHHMKFLVLCNHCDNPPCVRVCPTKATFRRPDGMVMMDMHRCIGCRYCMAGCPFGARSFNWKDPRPYVKDVNLNYPTREIGVVEKCTFCDERVAQGKLPACVEASGGALAFGDLGDPKSKVRELLRTYFTIRRKAHLGTNPQVYYIV
jgi:molybdopterin-containing oxidoreductase family iron-sulfur binding subunit